jgi:hypothetical protein
LTFNPLIVVAALLAFAGLAALPAVGNPAGVGHDRTLQLAVIHAELAACVMLFLPLRERTRSAAIRNLLSALACFAAASGCVLLLTFAARGGLPWDTRAGALAAWLFAGGVLSAGARLGGPWVARMRIALLCLFGAPALAHYFALEYSSASLLHLRGLSPSWALAAGDLSWLPLLPLAALPWAVALMLPGRKGEQ